MNLLKQITIDKGVRIPEKTAKPQGIYHVFLPQLQAMQIGDSFFREGETREDVTGLIRYAKRLNIHLRAEDLDEDEVYLSPGVRVERVSQDELPGRKPDVPAGDYTYWKLAATPYPRVAQFAPGDVPDPGAGYTQITPPVYRELVKTCPDHVTYWHHPESNTTWTYPIDKEFEGDGQSVRITGTEFKALCDGGLRVDPAHAESREQASTYWLNKITNMVIQYLPGKFPPDPDNHEEVTREKYLESQQARKPAETKVMTEQLDETKILTTYWRKKNGTCLSVSPDKYDDAKTKGWTEITRVEFDEWVAENDI